MSQLLSPGLCLSLLLVVNCSGFRQQWTEEDESKRIAELKREERRLYEQQMGRGSLSVLDDDVGGGGGAYAPLNTPLISPAAGRVYGADGEENVSGYPLRSRHHDNGEHRRHHHHHIHRNSVNEDAAVSRPSAAVAEQNWCFHCISPWNTLTSDMRQVVLNLLEVRRARPPGSASVVADCTRPRALDALPRQRCTHSHCQTLVLTDHETGSAFTLRGCAENFGAVDEAMLAERGDNTCAKLHDRIDIQECVCKRRKYCYAGDQPRRDLDYVDTVDGVPPPRLTDDDGNDKAADGQLPPSRFKLVQRNVRNSAAGLPSLCRFATLAPGFAYILMLRRL